MRRGRGQEFCCCYLPLVNVGAYMLVIETALVSLAVGLCALVPPSIVALMGAIPSWANDLVAALGFVGFAWQILGLVSVARQMPTLYRIYIRVNLVLTLAIIAATVAFLITGAVKRSQVVQTCISTYSVTLTDSSSSTSSGTTSIPTSLTNNANAFDAAGYDICNIFVWVQTGVMAGLIVLMAITQLYMLFSQRNYGQNQREANSRSYKQYHDIPLNPRDSGVWEPRDNEFYPSNQHNDYNGNNGNYAAAAAAADKTAYDAGKNQHHYSDASKDPTSPSVEAYTENNPAYNRQSSYAHHDQHQQQSYDYYQSPPSNNNQHLPSNQPYQSY